MNALKIGIASYDQIKARTLAIARGEHKPAPDEPKIWFTSLESLAKVLSSDNRELLELIAKQKPESLQDLAESAGRAKSNLSRTLKTMEQYGLVYLETKRGRLIPRVEHEKLELEVLLVSRSQRKENSEVPKGKISPQPKNIFVEKRLAQGDFAVRKPNSQRASAIEPTQRKAEQRAKEMYPNARVITERVKHTSKGNRDKWRKSD
jgi:predicted transcriptional regulator